MSSQHALIPGWYFIVGNLLTESVFLSDVHVVVITVECACITLSTSYKYNYTSTQLFVVI